MRHMWSPQWKSSQQFIHSFKSFSHNFLTGNFPIFGLTQNPCTDSKGPDVLRIFPLMRIIILTNINLESLRNPIRSCRALGQTSQGVLEGLPGNEFQKSSSIICSSEENEISEIWKSFSRTRLAASGLQLRMRTIAKPRTSLYEYWTKFRPVRISSRMRGSSVLDSARHL